MYFNTLMIFVTFVVLAHSDHCTCIIVYSIAGLKSGLLSLLNCSIPKSVVISLIWSKVYFRVAVLQFNTSAAGFCKKAGMAYCRIFPGGMYYFMQPVKHHIFTQFFIKQQIVYSFRKLFASFQSRK